MSKLTVTQLKRPAKLSPIEQRRAKLISKLEEQLAMARAEIAGEVYTVTKGAWARDAEGVKIRIERDKKLSAWWWKDATGYSLVIKYGARPLELSKGKRAISVATLATLPEIITTVIAAVENGELDAAIAAIAVIPTGTPAKA